MNQPTHKHFRQIEVNQKFTHWVFEGNQIHELEYTKVQSNYAVDSSGKYKVFLENDLCKVIKC